MNLYTDPYAYLRAASGHDTSTVIGTLSRLASNASAGDTTISLTTPTVEQLNAYDQITIFDGSSSEIVTVTATTASYASSLSVSPLQFAHLAGAPLASDGTTGSLAAMIVEASQQIETFCRQPLLQASYSSETLPLRSMRAAVSRDSILTLRPKHAPIIAVTAATLLIDGTTSTTLNIANAVIDADAQVVQFNPMSSTGGTTTFWGVFAPPARQTTPGFVQLSYTAGYAYSALPYDIRQAAIWFTSDLLSDRRNPTGAAEVGLGSMHLVTRLRGETSGRSVLVMRAEKALMPYAQRNF